MTSCSAASQPSRNTSIICFSSGDLAALGSQVQIFCDCLRRYGAAGLVSYHRPPSHQSVTMATRDHDEQNHSEDGQNWPPIV